MKFSFSLKEGNLLITVVDSDVLIEIVKSKNSRKRFRNKLFNKQYGYVYTTTHIIAKALNFLTDTNEIKRLFNILNDIHIQEIDIHIFTDAYNLFQKYHEDINLDLVDWITFVFVRDYNNMLEEAQLLSRNLEFDNLKNFENKAIISMKRIEL